MTVQIAAIALTMIALGPPLYALPASLSLPAGPRPGVVPLTLTQAARELRASGKAGMELVHAARALVAERMVYCRRNSFDIYPIAFTRGYGYCQQQAFALANLLSRLGFEARVVHALRNKFPDGQITAHAWVRVVVEGKEHDIDSIFHDAATGKPAFTPLSKVYAYNPAFRLLAGWGSAAVNAYRYYVTGKDR